MEPSVERRPGGLATPAQRATTDHDTSLRRTGDPSLRRTGDPSLRRTGDTGTDTEHGRRRGDRDAPEPVRPQAVEPLVSVVLPTYNEADNIPIQLDRLTDALGDLPHELIVVDDDSPDQTWRVAEQWGRGRPEVNVIRRTTDRGLSSAVVLGMSVASGRVLVVMDADLQHDETIIPEMVETVLGGHADVCVGSRDADGGSYGGFPAGRRFVSWVGARMATVCLPTPVGDPMSGFFALSRERFELVSSRVNPKGFKILLEFLARGPRPRVAEIGYRFGARLHGTTKLTGSVVVAYLLALIDLTVGRFVSATFTAYALVGASGVAVRAAAAWALATTGIGWASLAAVEISVVWNFWLNNAFTFSAVAHRGRSRIRPLLLFHLVSAQGLLVQTSVTALFSDTDIGADLTRWHWETAFAVLAGVVAATVGNYFLNSTITWPTSPVAARRLRSDVTVDAAAGVSGDDR